MTRLVYLSPRSYRPRHASDEPFDWRDGVVGIVAVLALVWLSCMVVP